MRITNNMLINNMMNNIGNNLTRMERYQNQLATGKKIQIPSDDPVVAARALKLRTDVSEVEQYQTNIKDAQSWLDITETTLGQIGDVLQRARELAVQAANGTNTPSDTQKIQTEIKQLRGQIIQSSNTTYAGRYIFSGFQTDKKLINNDSSSPEYGEFVINVANSEAIKYEIGIGDDINVNVLGGDLFNLGGVANGDTNGTVKGNLSVATFPLTIDGTNDILEVSVDGGAPASVNIPNSTYNDIDSLVSAIQSGIDTNIDIGPNKITVSADGNILKLTSTSDGSSSSVSVNTGSSAAGDLGMSAVTQVNGVDGDTGMMIQHFDSFITALSTADSAGISSAIENLDACINNVLRIRADVGARQNRLELTANRLDSDFLNFSKLMSQNEDVDMAQTIMNLTNEENVYRASLSGGARIIQPSLVDFLR